MCFSLGFPDEEAALSHEMMLDRVGAIAAAIPLPVSADLQAGYGADPDEVGNTIEAAILTGRGPRIRRPSKRWFQQFPAALP